MIKPDERDSQQTPMAGLTEKLGVEGWICQRQQDGVAEPGAVKTHSPAPSLEKEGEARCETE